MENARLVKRFRFAAALVVLATLAALPAGATTLIRMGVDDLVAGNQTIIVGTVVGVRSYWNADHSFILTDVRVRAREVLKGQGDRRETTLTIMGGAVGDITTLIIAGPEVQVGSEYVLFVNREDLPGVNDILTIRDLSQGIFNVVHDPSGDIAVSQANHHTLLADRRGITEPPGGASGISLDELKRQIRSLAAQRDATAQLD